MAASLRIHNLCVRHLTIRRLINLKLLRMPEMLEYISVFVSNRYFHNTDFLSSFGGFGRLFTLFRTKNPISGISQSGNDITVFVQFFVQRPDI